MYDLEIVYPDGAGITEYPSVLNLERSAAAAPALDLRRP
jgi:hypothetical protein